MKEFNITDITPEGWLRTYLKYEKKGILGNHKGAITDTWKTAASKTALLLDDEEWLKEIDEKPVSFDDTYKGTPIESDRKVYEEIINDSNIDVAKEKCDAILNEYMLLCGMHSLGLGRSKIYETGNISHFTWMLGNMLIATGESKYADAIERAVLNAGIASVGQYFGSLQSLSAVNQLSAAKESISVSWENSGELAMLKPYHPYDCAANAGRLIPEYIERMYMQNEDRIFINLYGDSNCKIGSTKLIQTGEYPFENSVKFKIEGDIINLAFRIPGWCDKFEIVKNGEVQEYETKNGYAFADNLKDGDVIEVLFNTEIKTKKCDGGVYFEYGCLLMALRIGEYWEKTDLKEQFPSYNVNAYSQWDLAVPEYVKFEQKPVKRSIAPWWDNKFFSSHPLEFETCFINRGDGTLHKSTLVPFGATTIRIAVFPEAK